MKKVIYICISFFFFQKRYQLSKKIEEDILKNKDLVEITEHEYSE